MLTDRADLDRAVRAVADARDRWVGLSIGNRIGLASTCIKGSVETAADMVAACCSAKGLDFNGPSSAEEWLAGPVPIIRNLRLLIETLQDIQQNGHPRFELAAPGASGETTARVFPRDRFDRLLYPGVSIDVWMEPGVSAANLPETMARAYRGDSSRDGAVALVLGAGNVASIGPMDVLYKLFVENHVVVLKMHPLNAYLGPLIARAFQPLVAPGYLRIVYGDAAEGQYLVHHRAVDEVHITGSAAVHDRIVRGDDDSPRLTKRITSELGCVTPVIVVPGDWSDAEMAYQAENVATMVAHNASCNCNAAKLLVTWAGWRQRQAFLDRIETILARLPQKKAYYPGSAQKHAAFLAGRQHARSAGTGAKPGTLPYAIIGGIDPTRADDVAFCEEAWSPVLAETPLPADDEAAFVDAAAHFCNERVAGTLSAVVVASPRSRAQIGAAFDRLIADLRYGTVAVNHWSAMSYALAVPPWGAYPDLPRRSSPEAPAERRPGHTLATIGSGIGFVHNTLMFERPRKTVLWGPFTMRPKPVWFCTHRSAHVAARQMVAFEASPSLWRLPRLAWAAMRG